MQPFVGGPVPSNTCTRTTGPAGVRDRSAVLYVEDYDAARRMSVLLLQHMGFEVLEADTVTAALALWDKHRQRIGLVMSDMRLPDHTGIDLARAIWESAPDMPVVICSGWGRAFFQQSATPHADSVEFLPKPYTVAELGAAIARARWRVMPSG